MAATSQTTSQTSSSPAATPAVRLRAVILLSGNLRSTTLSQLIARSVLDLPVEPDTSLLRTWCLAVANLRDHHDGGLDYHVFVDNRSPLPMSVREPDRVSISHDPVAYRGTGGVLHDVVGDYADEDYILAVFGPQLLREPLPQLTDELLDRRGDVVFFRDDQDTPSGFMLIRVAALRQVKPVGFVDFKEQALPYLAKHFDIAGIDRPHSPSWPLRTREDYIQALRWYYGKGLTAEQAVGPFAERWQTSFVVIEKGATVANDAHLHDAIILSDAMVGTKALVARSVIGSQASVSSGQTVVDQIVRPKRPRENAT